MNERNKKIPYDASPISRDYNNAPTNSRGTQIKIGFLPTVIIAVLVLVNIVLGGLVISSLSKSKPSNIVNLSYNVSATDTDAVVVAASKAKLNAVIIGAGGSNTSGAYSSTNAPTYNQMFSMGSRGSGVIISLNKSAGEAYILTCNHVISNAPNAVYICLYDSYYPIYATVVDQTVNNDLALLKVVSDQIKTSSCSAATIADSSLVTEGDTAIAVGNPQSNGFAVSSGIISRLNVKVTPYSGTTLTLMQIDAAINSGNSGGGLFDGNGNLIGIVESKVSASNIDNVAYAIPINRAKSVAENFMAGRHEAFAAPGYTVSVSGSTIKQVDGKLCKIATVVVSSVVSSSDAAQAGIKVGDQLVSFSYNGNTVDFVSEYSYDEVKYSINIGDVVKYKVIRSGTEMTINVTVSSLASK